jgi:hypothetical protein
MYALHSRMRALDFSVEPEVECSEDDLNGTAFVRATTAIGCWDDVEEFMACKMYHLASSFSFSGVTIGVEGPDVVSAISGRNGFYRYWPSCFGRGAYGGRENLGELRAEKAWCTEDGEPPKWGSSESRF